MKIIQDLLPTLLVASTLLIAPSDVLAAGGWHEISTSSSTLAIDVYGGPGFYYNPSPMYVRPGQQIRFTINTIYVEVQVKFDSGNWQTVKQCSSACLGPLLVSHPWTTPATRYMEMRWRGENGQFDNPRTFTVYVVPSANRAFRDDAGNTMTLWDGGNNTLDKPFIVIEGFDPTNDNFPEKYYQLGKKFFDDARAREQDMLIFNFGQGGIDLAVNAQHVIDGVNYINSIKSGANKMRLAGVSMGGVVARYAVAKAEANGMPLNISHFASIDSPQIDAVMDPELLDFIKAASDNDNTIHPSIGSTAAKQMLRYNPYDPTGAIHSSFYNSLNSLNGDGYPHLTKNIGVAFSNNAPNPNSGDWLRVKLSSIVVASYDIDAGESIDEAGSYLPRESTELWGRKMLLTYELVRLTHPTFIPHKSALHLDTQGNSRFDVIIPSAAPRFHDHVPDDIVIPLLNALDIPAPPLTASISGPSSLAVGQTGTWTASVSGGTPSYNYQWSYMRLCSLPLSDGAADSSSIDFEPLTDPGEGATQAEPCDIWYGGGSSASWSKSFNVSGSTWRIRLTVTDSSSPTQTKTIYKNVSVGSGGALAVAESVGGMEAMKTAHLAADAIPDAHALHASTPNPFSHSTEIRYDLPEAAHVRLAIYNLLGQEVRRLVDGEVGAGFHTVTFEAGNLPSSVYLYRITAGDFTQTHRMVLTK